MKKNKYVLLVFLMPIQVFLAAQCNQIYLLRKIDSIEGYIRKEIPILETKNIYILENITGIKSESQITFFGKIYPTLNDVVKWRAWYIENNLKCIKNESKGLK